VDFQLELAVSYEAAMQGDFDDLRFTQADGTTLVDAWCEVKIDDTSATVWVEFPTTPANTVEQTYYMYYGNSGASNNWDIEATFIFADDFSGVSLDTSKWNSGGIVSVLESKVSISGTNSYISGKTSFGQGYAIRGYGKLNKGSNGEASINFKSLLSYTNLIQLRSYHNEIDDKFRLKSAKDDSWGSNIYSTTNNEHVYHKFEIQRKDASNYYGKIDSEIITGSTQVPTVDLPPNLHSKDSTNTLEFDWILVRKYVANPATYGFGSEESAPISGNPFWYYNMLKRRN